MGWEGFASLSCREKKNCVEWRHLRRRGRRPGRGVLGGSGKKALKGGITPEVSPAPFHCRFLLTTGDFSHGCPHQGSLKGKVRISLWFLSGLWNELQTACCWQPEDPARCANTAFSCQSKSHWGSESSSATSHKSHRLVTKSWTHGT